MTKSSGHARSTAGPTVSRRALLTGAAAGVFMGPWKHVRVYAAATDKPIKIGLTTDASGQFGASGQSERRGMILAMEEANAKGGVLGRKLTFVWQDTETTPATGSRVAERFITREQVAFKRTTVASYSSSIRNLSRKSEKISG